MLNIKKYEEQFLQKENTPIFTVVADYYYKKRYYKQALKICNTGLSYDPNNTIGLYILAKLNLVYGKTNKAEQILKNIFQQNNHDINALLLLLHTMEYLKRSKKTIKQFVQIGHSVFINNQTINKYYDKYCALDNKRVIINKEKKIISKNIKTSHRQHKSKYNHQLATKTMYKLLLSQKKYKTAHDILSMMKEKTQYLDFVNIEIKKIEKLIKKEK